MPCSQIPHRGSARGESTRPNGVRHCGTQYEMVLAGFCGWEVGTQCLYWQPRLGFLLLDRLSWYYSSDAWSLGAIVSHAVHIVVSQSVIMSDASRPGAAEGEKLVRYAVDIAMCFLCFGPEGGKLHGTDRTLYVRAGWPDTATNPLPDSPRQVAESHCRTGGGIHAGQLGHRAPRPGIECAVSAMQLSSFRPKALLCRMRPVLVPPRARHWSGTL